MFYKTSIWTFLGYYRNSSAFVRVWTCVGYCSRSSVFVKVFFLIYKFSIHAFKRYCCSSGAFVKLFSGFFFIKLTFEHLYVIAVVVIVNVILQIPFNGQCVNILLSHNKHLIIIYYSFGMAYFVFSLITKIIFHVFH